MVLPYMMIEKPNSDYAHIREIYYEHLSELIIEDIENENKKTM